MECIQEAVEKEKKEARLNFAKELWHTTSDYGQEKRYALIYDQVTNEINSHRSDYKPLTLVKCIDCGNAFYMNKNDPFVVCPYCDRQPFKYEEAYER